MSLFPESRAEAYIAAAARGDDIMSVRRQEFEEDVELAMERQAAEQSERLESLRETQWLARSFDTRDEETRIRQSWTSGHPPGSPEHSKFHQGYQQAKAEAEQSSDGELHMAVQRCLAAKARAQGSVAKAHYEGVAHALWEEQAKRMQAVQKARKAAAVKAAKGGSRSNAATVAYALARASQAKRRNR